MHFLIYQKNTHSLRDEPDIMVTAHANRLELLKYALNWGIKLYPRERVKILNGDTGEIERGTNDIRAEIARIEAQEAVLSEK